MRCSKGMLGSRLSSSGQILSLLMIVDLTLEERFWSFNSCFLIQNENFEALRPAKSICI